LNNNIEAFLYGLVVLTPSGVTFDFILTVLIFGCPSFDTKFDVGQPNIRTVRIKSNVTPREAST
jgi:hypothetical protein